MRGLLMIERRGRAEISGVDERDAQVASRRFGCDRQAVDAAADDQDVVDGPGKSIEVARPHGLLSYSRDFHFCGCRLQAEVVDDSIRLKPEATRLLLSMTTDNAAV